MIPNVSGTLKRVVSLIFDLINLFGLISTGLKYAAQFFEGLQNVYNYPPKPDE